MSKEPSAAHHLGAGLRVERRVMPHAATDIQDPLTGKRHSQAPEKIEAGPVDGARELILEDDGAIRGRLFSAEVSMFDCHWIRNRSGVAGRHCVYHQVRGSRGTDITHHHTAGCRVVRNAKTNDVSAFAFRVFLDDKVVGS
jgi:hypothetical protein